MTSARVQGVNVSWEAIHDLFSLDRTVAHLNHGSFGAVPIPVQLAQHRLRQEMETNPTAFFARGLVERIAHTRRHLAAFLGADPDLTALVPNATAAVQIVLGSLTLRPGDEILLTDHAYGAVRLAVQRTCARAGAVLREVPVPLDAADEDVVSLLGNAVRPGRTKLAIVDHLSSPTARLFPVGRIVSALHDRATPVLVDAAHAPGMLPVEVSAVGADYWLGNLHKWAFTPRPTAVLAVAASRRGTIEPLVVSWQQDKGYPAAVEYGGTLDYTPWLAAPTGLHLLRTLGVDRVRRHNAEVAEYGQRVVAGALGVDPAAVPQPAGQPRQVARPHDHGPAVDESALVSMRLVPLPPGVARDRASAMHLCARIAREHACEVGISAWKGAGYVRLSGQIYNRREDYHRLASVLPRLLRSAV